MWALYLCIWKGCVCSCGVCSAVDLKFDPALCGKPYWESDVSKAKATLLQTHVKLAQICTQILQHIISPATLEFQMKHMQKK